MLLTIAAVLLAALLLIGTTLQSTYPDHPATRTRWFKGFLIATASLSGLMLIVTAIDSYVSQQRMEDALAGVSKTVFDRDIEFELEATYEPEPGGIGFVTEPFVILSVIPKESRHFCEIGVTSTPVVDSFFGEIFMALEPAPSGDAPVGFGDPTVSQFKFFFSGNHGAVRQRSTALPLVVSRRMSLDDYESSQFIAEVHVPGHNAAVDRATLFVKGKPVPFQVVRAGDRMLGSTVFRPTWEARCRRKRVG